VWSNVVIAITQCDKLPPSATAAIAATDKNIEQKKDEWKKSIQQQLQQLKVNEDHIKSVQICFTSHTGIPHCKVEPDWMNELLMAILIIAPKFKGAFNFIVHRLLIKDTTTQTVPSNKFEQLLNVVRQVTKFGGEIGADIGRDIGDAVDFTYSAVTNTTDAVPAGDIGCVAGKAIGKVVMTGVVSVVIWLYVKKTF
jgi:hypothetical protein